jgi:hypothetical protein
MHNNKRTLLVLAIAGVAMATFGFTASASATTLFADSFDRGDNTNLNASTTGKSGSLGALDWIEKSSSATAEINSNRILLGETGGAGGGWAIAYPNHNFNDALISSNGEFTVSADLGGVSSSGNVRFAGFGAGNSLTDLSNWSSNNPTSTFTSDFFMGYDPTSGGTAVGTYIFKSGTTQDFYDNQSRTEGTTLSATFTFADFNAGSTVNYEAFINGTSVKTGSFTWSGDNENYLFLYSNYSNSNGRLDNFEVSTVPEPTSAALFGLGLLGLIGFGRRRKR